jgi:hypothetical protein
MTTLLFCDMKQRRQINIARHPTDGSACNLRIKHGKISASDLLQAEDKGNTILRNIGNYLTIDNM